VAIYEVEWRRLPGGPEHYDTGMITGTTAASGTDFGRAQWSAPPQKTAGV
jgi:hypothetical protein